MDLGNKAHLDELTYALTKLANSGAHTQEFTLFNDHGDPWVFFYPDYGYNWKWAEIDG